MKKLKAAAVLMSTAVILSACSGKPQEEINFTGEMAYMAVPEVYATAVMTTQYQPVTAQMAFENGEEGIDIDLTVLSSTMVYSMVYCMVTSPDSYIGMTVKMCGVAASYHNEATDVYYHACIIQDATACCSQGIEYELEGDYPEDNEIIYVTGTFDTYTEGGYTYCILREASFV